MILTHFLVNEGEIIERIEVDETEIDADLLEMGKRLLPVLRKLTEEKEQQNLSASAGLETLMAGLDPTQSLSSVPQDIQDKMRDQMRKTLTETPLSPIETEAFPVTLGLSPLTFFGQKDFNHSTFQVWGEKVPAVASTVVPLISTPNLEAIVDITIRLSLIRGAMASPDSSYTELKLPLVSETTAKVMEVRPSLLSVLASPAKDLETREKMLQFSRSLAFAILERTERDRTNSN